MSCHPRAEPDPSWLQPLSREFPRARRCPRSLLFSRMSPCSSLRILWEAGRRMLKGPKSTPHSCQEHPIAKTSTSHGGSIPNSSIPDFPRAAPVYMENRENSRIHGAQFALIHWSFLLSPQQHLPVEGHRRTSQKSPFPSNDPFPEAHRAAGNSRQAGFPKKTLPHDWNGASLCPSPHSPLLCFPPHPCGSLLPTPCSQIWENPRNLNIGSCKCGVEGSM